MPPHIASALERIKDDDEQVKAFGVQESVRVCQRLLQGGHKTLHFYTMNLEQAVTQVIEGACGPAYGRAGPACRPSV